MAPLPTDPGCDPSLLQAVLNASTQAAIIATDTRGVITVFNPGAENLLGYSARDLVGRATPELFHDPVEMQHRARELRKTLKHDVTGFEVFVALAMEAGHEVRQWTYLHKDGTRIPVRLAVTVVRNQDNETIGFLGVAVDMRQELEALRASSETRQRLQAVLETVVDGVFTVDEQGSILSANTAACRIFGYNAEELVGNNISMLMQEPERSEHDGYIRRYLKTGKPRVIGSTGREVTGLRKDGASVPLDLAVSDLWLGDSIVFTGIVRDITQRKAAEKALLDAKHMLEERQARLDRDLDAAGEIQRHLLPKTLAQPERLEIAWRFEPSFSIGGDIFNILPLTPNSVGIYMLDVSGHGVDSALVAVSVSQQLRPENGLLETPTPGGAALPAVPCKVVQRLDADFPLERFEKFMTLVYLVLDTDSGEFSYCNAGHPPPLLLRRDHGLESLDKGGTVIGLGNMVPFSQGTGRMGPGDMLLFYTDGVSDYHGAGPEPYGSERLALWLQSAPDHKLDDLLDALLMDIYRFGDFKESQDDITLLGIRCKMT